jgi:hypothetical protein
LFVHVILIGRFALFNLKPAPDDETSPDTLAPNADSSVIDPGNTTIQQLRAACLLPEPVACK